MSAFLGIDTSNYTTSAAILSDTEMISCKRLLPVKIGSLGLRQSDAVFEHTRQLSEVIFEAASKASGKQINCVGVSTKPRSIDGSYMPCFLVGKNVAESFGALNGIKVYPFSHQQGHVAAALYSANRLDLLEKRFLAFHVSGGTTEALLVEPNRDEIFKCTLLAKTLDINMGQLIDRAGQMLDLPFPSGKYVDELSKNGISPKSPKICIKGFNCAVSGAENQCRDLLKSGARKEDISRFVIDFISLTLENMASALLLEYNLPILFAGGVMSNSIIKERFTKKFGALFAEPQYSSDNAAGIAVLAKYRYEH